MSYGGGASAAAVPEEEDDGGVVDYAVFENGSPDPLAPPVPAAFEDGVVFAPHAKPSAAKAAAKRSEESFIIEKQLEFGSDGVVTPTEPSREGRACVPTHTSPCQR